MDGCRSREHKLPRPSLESAMAWTPRFRAAHSRRTCLSRYAPPPGWYWHTWSQQKYNKTAQRRWTTGSRARQHISRSTLGAQQKSFDKLYVDSSGRAVNEAYVQLDDTEANLLTEAINHYDVNEIDRVATYNTQLAIFIIRRCLRLWTKDGFPCSLRGEDLGQFIRRANFSAWTRHAGRSFP